MEERKASAHPTKSFFVRMITRDITLEDCILDLIDNSIDEALAQEGSPPLKLQADVDLSKFHIRLAIDEDRFSIIDDCGGMTLDAAANYAFSFGRPDNIEADDFSIGVYGIGMKRAVFKLGRRIEITSTYLEDGQPTSFKVPIDVDAWLARGGLDWDFDIEDASDLAAPGVCVAVDDLTEETNGAFASPVFVKNLRRTIARDYTLHLARGLDIVVNGEETRGIPIELRQGDEFQPLRLEYEDDDDGTPVRVEILAGMAAPPPDDVAPDDQATGEDRFGWYVACNGRVVVAGDKTRLTGWGAEGQPTWHRQYSGFLGMMLFTSADAAALPLTTTKRSVDTSSGVYRRALAKAREVTSAWTRYTNSRKQDMEAAKKREAAAVAVRIENIRTSDKVVLPQIEPKPKVRMANVNYSVPADRMTKLAEAYGRRTMSYRDVGLRSFEDAYDANVDD